MVLRYLFSPWPSRRVYSSPFHSDLSKINLEYCLKISKFSSQRNQARMKKKEHHFLFWSKRRRRSMNNLFQPFQLYTFFLLFPLFKLYWGPGGKTVDLAAETNWTELRGKKAKSKEGSKEKNFFFPYFLLLARSPLSFFSTIVHKSLETKPFS